MFTGLLSPLPRSRTASREPDEATQKLLQSANLWYMSFVVKLQIKPVSNHNKSLNHIYTKSLNHIQCGRDLGIFEQFSLAGMTFVVILQTTFASLGYLCYRENVLGSIRCTSSLFDFL